MLSLSRNIPTYDKTHDIDELRDRDYARLDRAGPGLPGLHRRRPVRRIAAAHGTWNCCLATSSATRTRPTPPRGGDGPRRSDAPARAASSSTPTPDEYAVIFTANASGALKLVGESYPFEPGDAFLLTFDNHNSVNGIREFARAGRRACTYVPVSLPRCGWTRIALAPRWTWPRRPAQPVRLPGPVQLLRRPAPARMD